jgi:hypothetical protein
MVRSEPNKVQNKNTCLHNVAEDTRMMRVTDHYFL